MRNYDRRIAALEHSRLRRQDGFHCLQWWPGMSWGDVLARHDGGESIRRGDRVHVLRFGAVGIDDPAQQQDEPIAAAWLAERGAAHF